MSTKSARFIPDAFLIIEAASRDLSIPRFLFRAGGCESVSWNWVSEMPMPSYLSPTLK